ncbi:MAG: PilC/PilY family type IV pilus protein, partial [Ketobacteraceae bacterium]|nr:PilC/PilY family type IV pilus protein [Ketobacteraceae bacterium]
SAHTECRKSFSILMTDGYWSDGTANQATTAAARADNDSTNGVTHVNALSDNFVERGTGNYTGYLASDPFQDSNANTLADVAMYYWKNDLRSDLDNRIRVTQQGDGTQEIANPAYWQHMITFGVGLGVTGAQDPDAAFQAVKDGTAISWGDPTDASNIDAQNQAKLDDLLHASINSRGGFFSAASPDEFAARLRGILNQIASDESSSSSAVANTTRLDTDTLIYQAKFDPENWSGQLLAYTIEPDGSVDEDSPAWDADDKLPGHDARTILTYRPGSGASAGGAQFEWTNLTNTQKAYLNTDIFGNTDGEGQNRLEFLRGDTSITGPASNPFRDRTALSTKDTDGYDILGDIINSDPIYVGTGDFGYGRESSGLTATEKADYNTFRSNPTYRSRDGMIYIGANDGMFHGFDATTGREKFAYIPNALFPKLSALTSPDYTHQYYVDATPHMGDVYINNSWKTVVTSTLGAGGRAIFAIDVTDPDSVSASDVMWEVEANDADSNLRHIGYMLGKPQMVRTKSGDWVVLVGNGYNSADHQAALIVLDAEDGSVLKVINTGVGSAAEPNGLSTPLAVDLDGDRILDNVYAGDLHGNLWKFDLTANNPSNWGIALKSGNKVEPLFQACDGTGACTAATRQPITVQPTIASHPEGVMILFGTGKFFETADATVSASPRIESLYGIFDCGADSLRRACKGSTVVKSELVQQSILVEDTLTTASLSIDYRVGSDEDVTISNRVQGWYMDLIPPGTVTGEGERIVANPVLVNDAVLFVSFIPDGNPCNFGGYSWLMEFDPKTGGRFDSPKLDVNGDGIIDDDDLVADPNNPTGDKVAPCCIGQPEKRSAPGILHGGGPDGKTVFKVFSGSSGNIDVEINKGVNKAGRQSWRQLR